VVDAPERATTDDWSDRMSMPSIARPSTRWRNPELSQGRLIVESSTAVSDSGRRLCMARC
jgi:hypothetical protein